MVPLIRVFPIPGARFASAKEDEIDEEEVVDIENDEVLQEAATGTEETESPDVKDTGSVNADIYLLFTKPTFASLSNIGKYRINARSHSLNLCT